MPRPVQIRIHVEERSLPGRSLLLDDLLPYSDEVIPGRWQLGDTDLRKDFLVVDEVLDGGLQRDTVLLALPRVEPLGSRKVFGLWDAVGSLLADEGIERNHSAIAGGKLRRMVRVGQVEVRHAVGCCCRSLLRPVNSVVLDYRPASLGIERINVFLKEFGRRHILVLPE